MAKVLRIVPAMFKVEVPDADCKELHQAINSYFKLPLGTHHEVIDCDESLTELAVNADKHELDLILVWPGCGEPDIEEYFLVMQHSACNVQILRPKLNQSPSNPEDKWIFEIFQGKVEVTLTRSMIIV
jgi:hypothetical protein